MQTQLVNSDCIKHLKTLDDNIFDSCVTDPPYHLTSIVKRFATSTEPKGPLYKRLSTGFMGQTWDGGDVAFTTEMWKEVYRTLKPGAYLLAFSAARNYHRMAVAIEDSGFEIRDQIMWIYGSGFPKSLNMGKQMDKKLGNKRIKTGQVKTHARKGVAVAEERTAINAGSFGQEVEEEITVGTSEWEGWGTALKPAHEPIVMARKPIDGSVADNILEHRTGAINIDDCRVENQNRFPANVIHDGLEEEWARYFYCAKASKKEKGDTKHPTVKPVELMRYLVKLITPKKGIVLDPFAGTGTTGEACILENKKYYLIEAEPSYFKDIEKRLNRYGGLGI
jgi:site-specific DNA-methyltransferase (adenine-specific)